MQFPYNDKLMNSVSQVAIPTLTVSSQTAIALKFPAWGLIINMLAQPFWFYSAYKAYKKAGQSGLLVTTFIMTLVIGLGIINYWLLS